jgi:SAM-dependent methyltransferase
VPRVDEYSTTTGAYRGEVERSFDFTGMSHELPMVAKATTLLDVARRRLGDLSTKTALDVGCGVGSLEPHLVSSFAAVRGVDTSAAAVDEARKNVPGVAFDVYDGARLPCDDGSVDVAFAVNVMHHVPPSSWPAFARELLRVVRRGGLAFVFEHNPWNPVTRLAVFRCAFDDDATLLRRTRVRALLRDNGGRIVDDGYLLFVPINAPWARRVDAVLRPLPAGAQYFVAATPRS